MTVFGASEPHAGSDPALADVPIFTFILVKLASRCNIDCTYCYWFRDAEVYKKPPVLTVEAEDAFCLRLEEHIRRFGLENFLAVFHGGEPLLFPKRRFIAFQDKLRAIEERTGCAIQRGVTTNAILIDREWTGIFKDYGVSVSVSIDGPAPIHDKLRVDFKGEGTHAATMRGLEFLRAEGIRPDIIAVCNPASDPTQLLAYFADELGFKEFDILPPDAKHGDDPPPIDSYFIKLFDIWYDIYAARGVRISTLDAMIRGLGGRLSLSDTIGFGPIDTVTLMTDGTLEPLDVLRIAGDGSTAAQSSVFANGLQDVQEDPRWLAAFKASLALPDICLQCEFLDACGGGHLSQRWSAERQYDNPSVYCESWKAILDHIWKRIAPALLVGLTPVADTRASS
ncbi:MAG: radical SAM protein [Beijerinckiaceae bacterium]|nr:radical SAM protein [Beijerinckiaceae bacterium]